MIETTDSEIDLESLMADIREAVAKREASGKVSLIGATRELYQTLSSVDENSFHRDDAKWGVEAAQQAASHSIQLQPEFVPKDTYHINDLLQFHDHTFIWNAYRAILKRAPDESGLTQYLDSLRSGRLNKIDVIARLSASPEGRNIGVRIDGLSTAAKWRRLYRIPVLGYLLETVIGIARLPAMIWNQRRFETHALAQQERLATHINELSVTSFGLVESLSRELAQVSQEQKRLAELQYRQVVGLFREQREIFNQLKEINLGAYRRGVLPTTRSSHQSHKGQGWPVAELDPLMSAFAENFRGPREEVKEGLRPYLTIIRSEGIDRDVLDLGCGRGEWLQLLKDERVGARGVETSRTMIELNRERGLEVVEEDALLYLRALPDESLNAVTGFHLIEHLPFETFIELVDEIARTLRPNGLVVFETPNPKNLVVGACNFYADPTHIKPFFPETVQFILSQRGFKDVAIEYFNPVPDSPFTDESQGSQALNSWFFGPRDFAAVGRKSITSDETWRPFESKPTNPNQISCEVLIGERIEKIDLVPYLSTSGRTYFMRPDTEDLGVFRYVVESNEYDLPEKFSEDDVIIDIGAHIGSFSAAVLERGAVKVYAFEAHPINHAIASRNLAQFGDRVSCINKAVWRSDAAAQILYNDDITGYSHTGGISVLWNDSGVPVETLSLDELLETITSNFTKRIRLLKLDCEGAEYPILFTSQHLDIIDELCGEYHVIENEKIPKRAVTSNELHAFNSNGLTEFLEARGWTVETEAKSDADGLFRAWRKQ